MNTEYILTESFPTNIDEENCQQAPKYLLKGMEELGKNGNRFTRRNLLQWMEENINNPEYIRYTSNIRGINNLKTYWNLAKKYHSDENHTPHNARILNFDTFYRVF